MSLKGFGRCRLTFAHHASAAEAANPRLCSILRSSKRHKSTYVETRDKFTPTPLSHHAERQYSLPALQNRPLKAMGFSDLLRSLLVLSVTTLPKPLMLELVKITKKHAIHLDRSKVLRWIVNHTFYRHFCIGSSQSEIISNIAALRNMGLQGVVLTYGREATAESHNALPAVLTHADETLQNWMNSNFLTIEMLTPGDYIALRVTGAGPTTVGLLERYTQASRQDCGSPESAKNISNDLKQEMGCLQDVMRQICAKAQGKNVRVLIDAEGSRYQRAIDEVALNLMSEFNRFSKPHDCGDGRATILNTYQLYLKDNINKIKRHLQHSISNNYVLGLKLVRGAYMYVEAERERIHDSKQETDDAYNAAVSFLLSNGTWELPAAGKRSGSGKTDLLLATHNTYSVQKALQHYTSDAGARERVRGLSFAQLMGMADELSLSLAAQLKQQNADSGDNILVETVQEGRDNGIANDSITLQSSRSPCVSYPKVGIYKYTVWGTLSDCLLYLLRRAEENSDAVGRSRATVIALLKEFLTRIVLFRR